MSPDKQPYLSYGRQSISEEDIQAVVDVLRGDWLTQGPAVAGFERELADYCGARHAVACANGTAALHLACLAAGLKEGDELIAPAITFLASSNCAAYVGATPVFCDVAPDSVLMTPGTLAPCLTPRTRAIVPVHFAGLSCDMRAIAATVDRSRVSIIEDACHAIGGEYEGAKIGCCEHSDMTVFSFHPVKHVTTAEGGAILTNDDALAARLRLFRNHGMTKDPAVLERGDGPWYYEMHALGFNFRITDMQCALGSSQLRRLDAFVSRRRAIADRYRAAFQQTKNIRCLSGDAGGARHAWHLFVIQVDFEAAGISRVQAVRELQNLGIGTQVHYYPVPLQPYYRKRFGFRPGQFPAAEKYYEQALSIPMYSGMQDADVERVIAALRGIIG